MEVSVEEGLACLRGDGEARGDRALRFGKLARELLRFRKENEEPGCAGLVSRPGHEREGFHDLSERPGIAGPDAGRAVPRAAGAEPQGKALRLAQRDQLRRALALRGNVPAEPVDD